MQSQQNLNNTPKQVKIIINLRNISEDQMQQQVNLKQKSKQTQKSNSKVFQNCLKRKSPFAHQKILSSDGSNDCKTSKEKGNSVSKNSISEKISNSQQKLNSVQISKLIINNQNNQIPSKQDVSSLLLKVRQIKSMKFQNFSKNIKSELQTMEFQQTFMRFKRIVQSIDQNNCTPQQLQSIFSGFQKNWRQFKLTKQDVLDYLYPFYHKIPVNLSKKYAQFMCQISKQNQDKQLYKELRKEIIYWMKNQLLQNNNHNLMRANPNKEKLIPLYQLFELHTQISSQKLSNSIPKQKITEYLDKQRDSSPNSKIQNMELIESSIHTLIDQNNLKQAQKIIKNFNLPIKNYPVMIQKMEQKFLQYICRQHQIYFVDLMIKNRPSVIRLMVQLLRRRNKYEDMMHFVHKYKLFDMIANGNNVARDINKIYKNPLLAQDAFGPTQSDVLGKKKQFLTLKHFKIYEKDVIFINWETILKHENSEYLKQLKNCKQIGLDSQKSVGMHPFDKAKLQIIQIYCQDNSKVYIVDIRSFQKGQKMKKQMESDKLKQNQSTKKLNQVIEIDIDPQEIKDTRSQWDELIILITTLLTSKRIYGHCLHSDIPQIFQTLQINSSMKSNPQIMDSQKVFKQTYPIQTKSNLNYLCEHIYKKAISKYQQCSAWDYRPLRKSQLHYAALDAVLPLKLVKLMQKQQNK